VRPDEIDRILSREDDLLPSSGFGDAVMESVRQEAATPPPIPFPWRRAWAGVAVGLLALLGGSVLLWHPGAGGAIGSPPPSIPWAAFESVLRVAVATGAPWIALALVGTFLSVALAMRLVSGRA